MRNVYLADESAIARFSHPAVAEKLVHLGVNGALATCVLVDLEVLYSARTPKEYAQIADRRSDLVYLSLNDRIAQLARETQARLAARGQHRAAGVVGLLIAATAEYHGATVLHYDADFDHVAAVTGQRTEWIAPPGSL